MIGADLLRYKDDQRYLVWDVETEGLSLYHSRPWQIAYALCTNKGVESIHVHYPRYDDINVSEEAARITRFNKADYLARAEDPVTVLRDFEDIAMDRDTLLVGHNTCAFDCYIWQTMRRLQNKPLDWSFMPRMIDTLALSRAYRHMIQPDRSNFLAWQYKMLNFRDKIKKPREVKGEAPKVLTKQEEHLVAQKGTGCSLGAMAREFDIEYDERLAHDASYDINVNFEVMNRLFWCIEI